MTDDEDEGPTCPECGATLERKIGTAWPDRTFEGLTCPNNCDLRSNYT